MPFFKSNKELRDLLTKLYTDRFTGSLFIKQGEHLYKIYFDNGDIVCSEIRDKCGRGVIEEVLRFETGQYTLDKGIKSSRINSDIPSTKVLLNLSEADMDYVNIERIENALKNAVGFAAAAIIDNVLKEMSLTRDNVPASAIQKLKELILKEIADPQLKEEFLKSL